MKYTKDMLLESASGFVMPFPGHEDEDVQISLGYGEQTHPKTGERFHHQGLDLVAYHVPLYAIGTGVVTAVGNDVVHENFIICRYGKYEVKYGHVASVFARYGQPVEAAFDASVKAIAERMTLSESFTYHQASMIRHSMAYTTGVELRKAFIKGLMKMVLNTLKQDVSSQRLEVIREELYGMTGVSTK